MSWVGSSNYLLMLLLFDAFAEELVGCLLASPAHGGYVKHVAYFGMSSSIES